MTGRTAGQKLRAWDLVFRSQLLAKLRLVRRSFPIHIEDLIARPQSSLGIAMTIQTPLHLEVGSLENQWHLVDLSVTRRTADTFVDVNAVIEIDEIGEAMHSHPLDGFVGTEAFAHRLEIADIVEKHGMTIHAGLGWRNSRGGRRLHTGVTVPAVDSVVAHVVLMTKLDGLRAHYVLIGQVWRASELQYAAQGQGSQYQAKKDTKSCDEVRATVKNLRHVNFALWR